MQVISSEELSAFPDKVWQKIQKLVGTDLFDGNHPLIHELATVSMNTQENKGAIKKLSNEDYKEGLYAASGYQPMTDWTISALNQCWREDCEWTSLTADYLYPACH